MTEEDLIISNSPATTEDRNDRILRAVVPSHFHEFRDRTQQIPLNSYLHYGIPIYNLNGTVRHLLHFKFELVDWRFFWTGEESNSIESSVQILNRQFAELRHFEQDLSGNNYPFPLPTFTKVQIKKRGRYYLQPGLVLGHTGNNLRIQVIDGGTTCIRQQFTVILDPNETLPFGLPCTRSGSIW